VHLVQISKAFELGKYPVTQRQYQPVMGKNPGHFKKKEEEGVLNGFRIVREAIP